MIVSISVKRWGGLFGEEPEPRQIRMPIEKKVTNLVASLKHTKRGPPNAWINRHTYPLISRVAEMTKFPPDTVDDEKAGIAGSEIMSDIETFLNKHGVRGISAAPQPINTFDLFDANTWNSDSVTRSLAETFYWEQVQAVNTNLPFILTEVQNLLPKSEPK